MKGDPDNIEELASLEHEQWIHWMEYMVPMLKEEFSKAVNSNPEFGSRLKLEAIRTFSSLECLKRWDRQAKTPYDKLTDKEKESDRKEVRLKLEAYRK